jgi:hypothetical protein
LTIRPLDEMTLGWHPSISIIRPHMLDNSFLVFDHVGQNFP